MSSSYTESIITKFDLNGQGWGGYKVRFFDFKTQYFRNDAAKVTIVTYGFSISKNIDDLKRSKVMR